MSMRNPSFKWSIVLVVSLVCVMDRFWMIAQNVEENQRTPSLLATVSNSCGRTDDVPCLIVHECSSDQRATITGFKLTNTPSGNATPAEQQTVVEICHTRHGLHISSRAHDRFIFSPYTHCNDPVFVQSDVLEAFIAPVRRPTDNPVWYWELDTAPTAALWLGLSRNPRGNASYCADPAACRPGVLNCTGRNSFAPVPVAVATYADPANAAWGARLFVPFALFAPAGFPPRWPLYRANFYRRPAPS
jgi:hypothetical protein